MNELQNQTFKVTNSSGKTLEYEILFTFDSEETKKSYIVFTDNKLDKDGNIITYAATYEEDNEELQLMDIETESEWDLIETMLAQIEENTGEE